MVVSVRNTEFMVLPYVTGPKAEGQSLVIRDAATQKVLLQTRIIKAPTWHYPMLRLPPGTREVEVEAIDAGSGWGQWHAMGVPRRLKN